MGMFDELLSKLSFKKSNNAEDNSVSSGVPPGSDAGVAEIKTPANQQQKKLLLLGGGLAAAAATVVLLTGEDGTLMLSSLFNQPTSSETSTTDSALTGITSAPGDVALNENSFATDTPDEEEGDEVEEAEISQDTASETPENLPKVAVEGPASKERAWEALKRMDEWRAAEGCDEKLLKQYFAHKKSWVQLSALEIAIRQEALSDIEVRSVANSMKSHFRADQMRRWLKRVKARDTETYNAMITALEL